MYNPRARSEEDQSAMKEGEPRFTRSFVLDHNDNYNSLLPLRSIFWRTQSGLEGVKIVKREKS